jgi:glycosyltransferase involved in cell wall biosynthesis
MKIVFIAIKGIDKIGGIETYTRELGQRLVKNGHEIIVYTLKDEIHQAPYNYKGMSIIPLPAFRKSILAKLSLVLLASFHQFKHRDVDLVHYHAIGPSMFCIIPRMFGRTTVVQSHGHEWKWTRSKFKKLETSFFHFAEKVAFICSSQVTAVSKELTKDYENKHNRHVQYIPNGINEATPLKANLIKKLGAKENNYILFLGRISREKGIHHLIKAYQQLDTSMQLVIVGQQRLGDTYLSELQELANGNPNILFPGIATGDLWNEWYSNAAISVLPSETEGLPIALLEAMSFGKCCITSDIPPNKEALADVGITFESMNVASLVEGLKQLINDPEKRKAMGNAAKERVYSEYSWNRVTRELERFYLNSIIKQRSQPQLSINLETAPKARKN